MKFSPVSNILHGSILYLNIFKFIGTCFMINTHTVGENIIATTKIRNNYGAIQSFIFPIYCESNIGLFYIAPCKVITLNPLCILFGISSLLLFWWLPIYCYSNYRDSDSFRSFSLLIAIRLPILFANAFKSVKEQQLLLSQ